MANAQTKKIVLIAFLGFWLLELLDWTGVTRGGFPKTWAGALFQACINIGWAAFCTVVAYFVMIRPTRQQSSAEEESGKSQASDRH